ncbi:MAG: lipoyl synthase [bacterium]
MSLPSWIKKRAPKEKILGEMKHLLRSLSLHTVCEEARCPNIGECFAKKTATFMILGNRCTRNCRFCAVEAGSPPPPDLSEPENVARAVNRLSLRYVVITSVTRDDLPDGGASQFARTIKEIRKINNGGIRIEILVPDFKGSLSSLKAVIEARPNVLNHNLETVPRFYRTVRPKADYSRSLKLLRRSKEMNSRIYTKSGLMVGLGEEFGEVVEVMKDLRDVGCNILTLGQYLRPSPEHLEVKEFVKPEKFKEYETIARSLGFSCVAASPFVRSSYQAKEALMKIKGEPHKQRSKDLG